MNTSRLNIAWPVIKIIFKLLTFILLFFTYYIEVNAATCDLGCGGTVQYKLDFMGFPGPPSYDWFTCPANQKLFVSGPSVNSFNDVTCTGVLGLEDYIAGKAVCVPDPVCAPPPANFTTTAGSVNFPDTRVDGDGGLASANQTVITINNTGGSSGTVSLSSLNPHYDIITPSPVNIPAAGNAPIVVRFDPTAVGSPQPGTIRFTPSVGSIPDLNLNGNAIAMPTGSVTVPTLCQIAAGASTCSAVVNWSVTNPSNPRVLQNGIPFAPPALSGTTRTFSYGTPAANLIQVVDDWGVVDSVQPTISCQPSLVWTGSVCAAAPTVNFNASTNAIFLGSTTTLSWTTADATSCVGTGGMGGWASGKPTSNPGGTGYSPIVDTTFTLTCNGPGGTTTRNQVISVVSPNLTNTQTGDPRIFLDTGTLTVNSSATFRSQVQNNGTGNSGPFDIQFSYKLGAGATTTFPVVSKGSLDIGLSHSVDVSPPISLTSTGNLVVRYCIDVTGSGPNYAVRESNETDNCHSTTFVVRQADLTTTANPVPGTPLNNPASVTFTGTVFNGTSTTLAGETIWPDIEIDWNRGSCVGAAREVIYNAGGPWDSVPAGWSSPVSRNLSAASSQLRNVTGTNVHCFRTIVDQGGFVQESNNTNNTSPWQSFVITGLPACSDGIDNNTNGFADFGGVDTDGNGSIDIAAEPGCNSLTDTTEAPSPTLNSHSIPPTCTIPAGGSSCTVSIAWNIANSVPTPSIRQNGNPFSSAASSLGTLRTVTTTPSLFEIYATSTLLLASGSSVGVCATGTAWNGSICRRPNITASSTAPATGTTYPFASVPAQVVFSGSLQNISSEASTPPGEVLWADIEVIYNRANCLAIGASEPRYRTNAGGSWQHPVIGPSWSNLIGKTLSTAQGQLRNSTSTNVHCYRFVGDYDSAGTGFGFVRESNETDNASAWRTFRVSGLPQCSDGTDNDNDGRADFGAGIDKDGDGTIDLPPDAGCSSDSGTSENQPPTVSITAPVGPSVDVRRDTPINFDAVASDPENGVAEYEWREGNCTSGTVLHNSTLTAAFSKSDFTIAGSPHRVYFRAKDNANSWSTSCPYVDVNIIPPVLDPVIQACLIGGAGTCVSSPSFLSIYPLERVKVTWDADTTATCSGVGPDLSVSSYSGEDEVTPPGPPNSQVYSVTCDNGYDAPTVRNVGVTANYRPPTLTASLVQVLAGENVDLSWDTKRGSSTACTLTGGSITGNALSGNPADNGVYTVPVYAQTDFKLECPQGSVTRRVYIHGKASGSM